VTVTIAAGEPELACWCAVCLTPTQLRVDLTVDGEIVAILEICPGCGTGHPNPTVPSSGGRGVSASPAGPTGGHASAAG
jgi:hypothetical protein